MDDDDGDETTREDVQEPEELAQYKWRDEYEDDLRDMATRGVMSPEWPILANIIRSRIVYNTRAFLAVPPRKPPHPHSGPSSITTERTPLLPATSIDSFTIDDVPLETLRPAPAPTPAPHDTPSTPGGLVIPPFPPRQPRAKPRLGLAQRTSAEQGIEAEDEAVIGGRTLRAEMRPGEAWEAVKAVIKLMDEFPTSPPFTIQRLCELAWKPFQQHTSIGKYLRAVEKNLLVTTTYADDAMPPESENGQSVGGHPAAAAGVVNGSIRSRASSVSSTSSSSSQNAPLFSPIPFLVERRVINPDGTPVIAPATVPGGGGGGEVDAHVAALEIDVPATPNDEDVAMGEGDSHEADQPDTPRHALFDVDRAPAPAAPLNHLALSTSSIAVLASNGSTTTTTTTTTNGSPLPSASDPPDAAHEPFTGRVDELDAGPLVADPAASPTPADPHQLHLGATTTTAAHDGSRHQEGTGEHGTMTPHAMADRPQAISSTTDLTAGTGTAGQPGGGAQRTIRAMPRTGSVASSLNERFVAGETLAANVPGGDDGAEARGREEGKAEAELTENPAKAVKLH
ncbi:hypothetical protein NliqN6_4251 [Naganishia liquefaciens]|uniref:Uncharacterized protein n=1 Tax=Naganishia liquefaciens TaxID=104408 RepID=A0A8H3YFP4_9TREE|nr:hypothetical protein NliqN6_4251 [Naganishia liquefaciens]